MHKQPPRIYGLPKIHKPEIPLRPIVSCVNTFAYDLSAHLADILYPLSGESDYTVPNSSYFVSTISNERIQENEVMVAADVESLFTNVPIEGAARAALCKVENDPGLADRTNLTPTQIVDGVFPEVWKSAKVVALFKGGDKTLKDNYRPISILPTISKIIERSAHVQLCSYLEENKLL